jgi:hypothetical protein
LNTVDIVYLLLLLGLFLASAGLVLAIERLGDGS